MNGLGVWIDRVWVLGLVVLGVAASVAPMREGTARFETNEKARKPAAFVSIQDSDVPAATIYADAQAPVDFPNEVRPPGAPGITRHYMDLQEIVGRTITQKMIETIVGFKTKRARAVHLSADALLRILSSRPLGEELDLKLGLFSDVQPVIRLKVVSGYDVNQGLHSGPVVGDTHGGQAQFSIDGREVAGRISAGGHQYRIISDPEFAVHYIVELP